MTEPSVQVPRWFLEDLAAGRTSGRDEARTLLAQPTLAVEACTGGGDCTAPIHVHGCFADTGTCNAPDEHAAPPSIADMAPGTTFYAVLIGTGRFEQWMRVNSCHPVARMRDGLHADTNALDPSTVRDVTPKDPS